MILIIIIYRMNIKMDIHKTRKTHSLSLIILSLLFISAVSISVPITTRDYRCMIVYSSSEQQNIKIDIKTPKFNQSQQHDQYFVVWINNTQTFQSQFNRVNPGQTFRRQQTFQPNKKCLDVIYKVCFRINSTSGREIGPVDIQYQAYHLYTVHRDGNSNVKLPDSILKQNDFKQSYDDAEFMREITTRHLDLNKNHKIQADKYFNIMNETTQNLILISGVEIAFVIVVALIQFFVIKKHLAGQLRF